MMSDDFDTLRDFLQEWDGRRRQQELVRGVPRGLLAGLLIGLVAALLSRWQPLLTRTELAIFSLATALIGFAVTGFIILLRRRTVSAQARFADRQFGLLERMTTAVEIQTGQLAVDREIASRQLGDAIGAATAVDSANQIPLRSKLIEGLPALVVALALIIALWLPNPQEAVLLEQRALAKTIEQQIETLTALAEEISANDALSPEQRENLMRPLDEALAALGESDLNREEAVAALSQAETELRSLSQELSPPALDQALADAAASLSGSEAAAGLAEALQAGQLAEASAAAGALAAELPGLSPTEQAALAERLAETAAGLQPADAQLAGSLERAAEALAEGDIATAQAALGEAATALAALDQAAMASAQASDAAEQLGTARNEVAQSGTGEPSSDSATSAGGAGQGQTGSSGTGNTATGGGQQGSLGGPSQGGGHVENVFVPEAADLAGQGEDVELEVQCLSDPDSCGPVGGQTPSNPDGQMAGGSLVPYDQVFGDYRDAAIEALAGGDIPIGMQDIIRDYFSALEP